MATWKKLVVSGSNVSQLNNDAGYLTAGTITQANGYATASANGVELLAANATASLNFASSSGQGLTIAATSGPNTLTFGLSAVPNASLLNSGSIIGNTVVNLGTTVTSLTGLTNISSTSFTGSLLGTASYADNAGLLDGLDSTSFVLNSQTSSMNVLSASYALTASHVTTLNQNVIISGALDISISPYSSNLQIAGNGFGQTYLSSNGAMVLNPGSGGVGMAGVNQYITLGYIVGQTAGTILTGSLLGTASYADNAGLLDGLDSTSFVLNSQTSSMAVSSSLFALTASYALNGNSTLLFSGSTGNGSVNLASDVFSIIGTNNEIETSAATNTVQIGLPNDVTIGQDLIVTRNLTVFGTASFQSTENLLVADRFVLLASGSTSAGDGGIVVQQGTQGFGEAFVYDANTLRWAVTGSYNANQATFIPEAFMAAVIEGAASDPTAVVGKLTKKGNIFTAADESIWIYS